MILQIFITKRFLKFTKFFLLPLNAIFLPLRNQFSEKQMFFYWFINFIFFIVLFSLLRHQNWSPFYVVFRIIKKIIKSQRNSLLALISSYWTVDSSFVITVWSLRLFLLAGNSNLFWWVVLSRTWSIRNRFVISHFDLIYSFHLSINKLIKYWLIKNFTIL